jgi:hypothetical protein
LDNCQLPIIWAIIDGPNSSMPSSHRIPWGEALWALRVRLCILPVPASVWAWTTAIFKVNCSHAVWKKGTFAYSTAIVEF